MSHTQREQYVVMSPGDDLASKRLAAYASVTAAHECADRLNADGGGGYVVRYRPMPPVEVRLMETVYGDRYVVVDAYKSANAYQGWTYGACETVPARHDVPPHKIASDTTVDVWEMPLEVYEALTAVGLRDMVTRGAQATSPRKAAASRENGKKGGRPKKEKL